MIHKIIPCVDVEVQTERILTSALLFLLILSIVAIQGLSLPQAFKVTPSYGSIRWQVSSYSYVIMKENDYTVMRDGETGTEITRSTDAASVLNRALSDAFSEGGGSILVKYANYSVNDNIAMKSNTALVLEAGVIIEATYTAQQVAGVTGEGIARFRGTSSSNRIVNSHIIVPSGRATIRGKGDSVWEYGVEMIYADSCSAEATDYEGLEVTNVGGNGVYMRFASYNLLENLYIHGYAKAGSRSSWGTGVVLHGGNVGNNLNYLHVDGELGSGVGFAMAFDGGWGALGGVGDIKNNVVIGGIYERSGFSHAIYWCSDGNGYVINNTAIGGLSRGCRGSSYSCGFKLNPSINSYVNWTVENCSSGIEIGNGGPGGGHGNIVYAKIRNVGKGLEMWTQGGTAGANTENNEVHLDINGASYDALNFFGFQYTGPAPGAFVQHNTIYCTARNCTTDGIRFGDYGDMSALAEARNNTLYVDIQAARYGVHWDTSGYGRWNTFYGYWDGGVTDLYSESGQAVIDTNTFYPGILP